MYTNTWQVRNATRHMSHMFFRHACNILIMAERMKGVWLKNSVIAIPFTNQILLVYEWYVTSFGGRLLACASPPLVEKTIVYGVKTK